MCRILGWQSVVYRFLVHCDFNLWPSFQNNCVRSISPLLFELVIPNLVCGCILGLQNVLRHKAGQEGRGEILLENSFMRWRCYQGKIMHTTSKNFSVLYVLRKHQQHINIQRHHLRCYFWLIDHPILEQVATPRSFQLESILECPALDVRQIVRNKRRKEYD